MHNILASQPFFLCGSSSIHDIGKPASIVFFHTSCLQSCTYICCAMFLMYIGLLHEDKHVYLRHCTESYLRHDIHVTHVTFRLLNCDISACLPTNTATYRMHVCRRDLLNFPEQSLQNQTWYVAITWLCVLLYQISQEKSLQHPSV